MNRIQTVVDGMTDEQLRLLVEVTNHPVLIASVLNEAYQELSGRDNQTPGTFSGGERGGLESTLPEGCQASAWIGERA